MIKNPISGDRKRFTFSDTTRTASMSRPESVSSRTASSGLSSASCRISFRFFSAPERFVDAELLQGLAELRHELPDGDVGAPDGAHRRTQEVRHGHARYFDRVLEGEEQAELGPVLWEQRRDVLSL